MARRGSCFHAEAEVESDSGEGQTMGGGDEQGALARRARETLDELGLCEAPDDSGRPGPILLILKASRQREEARK